MSLSLHRVLTVSMVCLAVCASHWQSSSADDTAISGQKVFTAGHSFHYFMPDILTDVCKKAGIADHKKVGLQAIGGSKVIVHWNHPAAQNTVKPALESGQVDVLTLSPIYLPDEGIELFAKLAVEKNPKIRVTVQEFWLPFESQAAWDPKNRPKEIDRDSMTVEQLQAAHADYFKAMDAHVTELNEKLGKQVIFVVPSGQAVMALRGKVIKGEAPGITKQSQLFTDVLGHVNEPIKTLATYCHFSVIYKRSPVGIPVPEVLKNKPEAEKLNTLLQELAWDAVTKHPLSGVKADK